MSHLSIRERFLLLLRLLTIAVSITVLCIYFGVHTHAQARLTATDAVQDAKIAELSAAKDTLIQTFDTERQKVEALEERVSTMQGIGIGGMAVLSVIQAAQVILQLKRKP